MNSSSKKLLMLRLRCLRWTFWGSSISMTWISARRPLEATASDCCANEVPVMLKYWCWPIYLSMAFHADLPSLSTKVATHLPAMECYISQRSKKVKHLPLLCPKGGAMYLIVRIEMDWVHPFALLSPRTGGKGGEGWWGTVRVTVSWWLVGYASSTCLVGTKHQHGCILSVMKSSQWDCYPFRATIYVVRCHCGVHFSGSMYTSEKAEQKNYTVAQKNVPMFACFLLKSIIPNCI